MKRILLLAAYVGSSVFAMAQSSTVINDKNAEARNVKGFHAIHISSGIDLYLSQGSEAVAVSASNPDYRSKIITEVQDGVLEIYIDHNWHGWNWHDPKLKAYVSIATIDRLRASGGSDVYLQGTIKADKLDVDLSGGSDLKGALTSQDLSIEQSGGSDVTISGTVANLTVHASGGSDLHGYDLVTDMCSISASGGSDSHITVNKELTVNASGGSDISYKGNGVIRMLKTSGSSSITKKD